MESWARRRYREQKAWVLVDRAGSPRLDERGLASLRYRPDDARTYSVRPEDLGPVGGEEQRVPAGADPIRIWLHVEPAGLEGDRAVGAVLVWRDRRRELAFRLGPTGEEPAAAEALARVLAGLRRRDLPVRVMTPGAGALRRWLAATAPPDAGAADSPLRSRVRSLSAGLELSEPEGPEAGRARQVACGVAARGGTTEP